jgi:hypothetical protein
MALDGRSLVFTLTFGAPGKKDEIGVRAADAGDGGGRLLNGYRIGAIGARRKGSVPISRRIHQ